MSGNKGRLWFGTKRIGYGYRPQTWQGWLIVALFIVIVPAIAIAVSR